MRRFKFLLLFVIFLLTALPLCAMNALPPVGLVASYDFTGDAADSSGNSLHGILHGTSVTSDRFGNMNSAIYLNKAVTESIELPGQTISGDSLTVNFWALTLDNGFALISGANSSQANEYLLYYSNGMSVNYHGTNILSADGSAVFHDGLWHMVTIVTTPIETRVYLDGQLVKSAGYLLDSPLEISGLWIGQDQDSLNGGFDANQSMAGRIDDLSIHSRALTDVEIAAAFEAFDSGSVFGDVSFPGGESSFADEVISFVPGPKVLPPYNNPERAVGIPDETATGLGWGGELVVRFSDNALTTSGDPLNDLWVFEVGGQVEPSYISISDNGFDWISIGRIEGSTRGIDLDSFTDVGVVPGRKYNYVKIVDADERLSVSPYAGADINAVGAIESTIQVLWVNAFPKNMAIPGDLVELRVSSTETSISSYQWSIECPDLDVQPELLVASANSVQWLAPDIPFGMAQTSCTTTVSMTDQFETTHTVDYAHLLFEEEQAIDSDSDGLYDHRDNCPYDYNPEQNDVDSDWIGDLCDVGDFDGDGVSDYLDSCPSDSTEIDDSDADGQCDFSDAAPFNSKIKSIDNLLENSGFEDGLNGWQTDYALIRLSSPEPYNGLAYLTGGTVANSSILQNVDLPLNGADTILIDEGKQKIFFRGWQAGYSSSDLGRIEVRFKDELGNHILTENIGDFTSSGLWGYQEGLALLPVGSRSVDFVFVATRVSGTNNDAYLDDVFLGLIYDADDDGVYDTVDNCSSVANPEQSDANNNGIGDACDYESDTDGDGVSDAEEYAAGTDPSKIGVLPPGYKFPEFIAPLLIAPEEGPVDGQRPLPQ